MSSSEEDSEGERERLRSSVVTSTDLHLSASTSSQQVGKESVGGTVSTDMQAFLVRKLEEWLDSNYDITATSDPVAPPAVPQPSSGILLTSTSLLPLHPPSPHDHTHQQPHPFSESSSCSDDEDDLLEQKRLREAVVDPAVVLSSS